MALGARGLTTPVQLYRSSALAEGGDRGAFSLSQPPQLWMLGYRVLELDTDIVRFAAHWESLLEVGTTRLLFRTAPPQETPPSSPASSRPNGVIYMGEPPKRASLLPPPATRR